MISYVKIGHKLLSAAKAAKYKKHAKYLYKKKRATLEQTKSYSWGKKKTGYGSFVDKIKWI
jgi:hypothetical protein